MQYLSRTLVAGALVLNLTGAANMLYAGLSGAGLGGLLSFLFSILALAFAHFYLKQEIDVRQNVSTSSEILLFLGILFLPVFVGNYWVDYAPDTLSNLGLTQLQNTAIAFVTFQLALFLDEKALRRTAQFGLVLYVLSVLMDLATGGIIVNGDLNRPGGFLMNANNGAFAMVFLLLLSLSWRQRSASGYFWILVAFCGIAVTLSRSGLLLAGIVSIAFAGLLLFGPRRGPRLATIWALFILAFGLVAFVRNADAISGPGPFSDVGRLVSIASLLQGDASSANNSGRLTALRLWIEQAEDAPSMGRGTGYSLSDQGPPEDVVYHEGPHNMYVARMADAGALGLGTFLAYIVLWFAFFFSKRHFAGILLVGLFATACIFDHELGESRYALTAFMILAAEASIRSNLDFSSGATCQPERDVHASRVPSR